MNDDPNSQVSVTSLANLFCESSEEIVDQWYEEWKSSPHPHPDVSATLLRDKFALQLRVIGEQLRKGNGDLPRELWIDESRLDPEHRVEQKIPIEELVLAYKILVNVVRQRIEEGEIRVSFPEYTYFFEAIFELVAESVRRYARYEAEKVRAARSRHLASVTHQMRTPINSISLAAQVLNMEKSYDPTAINALTRGVNRLQRLVDGLMRLERFSPEEVPVRPKTITLDDLISEIVEEHKYQAEDKGLALECSYEENVEAILDPSLCHDAISNLVENAIKFTSEGSVRIEAESNHDELSIRVIDSGPGIEPERQKKLFHPVSPEREGVGLGLTIAYHSIQAQGGSIGVESEPGSGSAFWIQLPREVKPRTD